MPQYQGIWTLAQAAQLQSTQRWATDPLYKNTTLLLQADNAANGAQNNTFLDSSSNNFTITRNGNTTQGTFTPYSATGWGNYFAGSSDYLTAPSNTAFAMGTGDFTVECWFYLTNTGNKALWGIGDGTTSGGVMFRVETASNRFNFYNTTDILFTGAAIVPFVWYHVAVVRSAGSLSVYLNGLQYGSSVANTTNIAQNIFYIGAAKIGATVPYNPMEGYLSNLRVIKGTAVYTANFNPSTSPLTAITNTSLLTCQSNRFVDNSTNNFTISVAGGTPSVQAFSPFAPQYQYTPSVTGGSGYFDGSGDFLTTPSTAALSYGTSDYSQEFWIYLTTSPATFQRPLQYSDDRDNIVVESGNFNFFDGTASTISAATTGQWFHLCVTRVGGTLRGFVNGRLGFTRSGTYNSSTRSLALGATSGGANPLGGYTTNYRIVKGGIPTAYSTSSTTVGAQIFTPPTTPFTGSESLTAGSVSLLLNFTNAGIYDGTLKNNLETVGNAQVSTSVVKYGTGSMYFDGTGDYLVSNTATPDLYAFGSGDFTIECWVYLNSVVGYGIIYDGRPTTAQTTQPTLFHSGGTIAYYTNGANRIVGSALSTSTWYHIALARSGTSTKLFVDGTQVGSTYTDSTVYTNTSGRPWIGADSYSIGNNLLNGYIDDLRVTKGIARYTANFIPPSVALPRQ